MNTVAKGDRFEQRCYELISHAINNEILGAIPSQCKLLKKPAYFSSRRDGKIIFDLSIEVWPPNSDRPVLIYLIECKDLTHSVPVDDVEEFEKKIDQVAGKNVKGVVIARNSFQSGAFNFAKSGSIMLIEAKEDGNYSIILHRTNRLKPINYIDSKEAENRMFTSIDYFDEELVVTQTIIDTLIQRLFEEKDNESGDTVKRVDLKRLSRNEIDKIAKELISTINPYTNIYANRVSLKEIELFLKEEFNLVIDVSQSLPVDLSGRKILGYCDLKNKIIRIDNSIIDTERFAFVLAHEIGHFILHSNLTIEQEYYDTLEDSEFSLKIGKYENTNERHWIEWQANYFAMALLMPRESVIFRLIQIQEEIGVNRRGLLYIDNQTVNITDFKYITTRLADFFGVNKTNVVFRLEGLKLIKYGSKVLTLGQIISKI